MQNTPQGKDVEAKPHSTEDSTQQPKVQEAAEGTASAPASAPAKDSAQTASAPAQKTDSTAAKPRKSVQGKKRSAPAERKQPKRRKKPRVWPRRLALVLIIAAVAVALLCSWQYWWRYDDVADIQGTWKLQGSTEQVVINQESMKLSADVSYDYHMDTTNKTITYEFGSLKGTGSYHFTEKRQVLVIREGSTADIPVALGLQDDPALTSENNLDNGIIVLEKAQ